MRPKRHGRFDHQISHLHPELYPFPLVLSASVGHQAHGVAKSPSSLWHRRLGHPLSGVVHQVLRDNNIPFSGSDKEPMCDVCQMAKSHQVPYPK